MRTLEHCNFDSSSAQVNEDDNSSNAIVIGVCVSVGILLAIGLTIYLVRRFCWSKEVEFKVTNKHVNDFQVGGGRSRSSSQSENKD